MSNDPKPRRKSQASVAVDALMARGGNGVLCNCRSVTGLKGAAFRYRRDRGQWAAEIRVTGRFVPALEDNAPRLDVVDRVATTSGRIICIHEEDGPGMTLCVVERPFIAILVHPAHAADAPAEDTRS